ncbi:MAG TPA: MgtC/SapB family protein [Jatrophihabitantaceae bacterium]|jgi:putative Mg2+ transporter-C (MgtC) family protein
MTILAAAAANGQTWRQVGELLLAFALSSVIGLERQFRGKGAGLRTQAIVGTAAALIMLVSKYGFADVLSARTVVLDPSRVAAQVVTGIGFLGAGLIITRHGAIRGLTTAASVWETAAIGMAAGAGLPLLALLVTALHFVIVLGYAPLTRLIAAREQTERGFTLTYEDGRGVLRAVLAACTSHAWIVKSVAVTGRGDGGAEAVSRSDRDAQLVTVALTLRGRGALDAAMALTAIPGVVGVYAGEDEDD